MKCPYGNERCLCQTCENNPVENEKSGCFPYCKDCEWKEKQIHDLWLCSKYKPKEGEQDEQVDKSR